MVRVTTVTLILCDNGGGQHVCPGCSTSFTPSRRNQRYCTPPCQKRATRNASRCGPRGDSWDVQHRSRRDHATLQWLNEVYYGTPPGERLGLVNDWLGRARAGDKHLRHVLGNPLFFAPKEDAWRRVCFRRSRYYPPVPLVADRLCRRLMGCRVWEWVTGRAPEPETGEVV